MSQRSLNPKTLRALCTGGLTLAPSQVSGGIRLVPILRAEVRGDLRLGLEGYSEGQTLVDLGGREGGNHTWFGSYVPYGMIEDFTRSGEPVAAARTGLGKRSQLRSSDFAVKVEHRLVKRRGRNSLRMLPLAAALDGFLALHFAGPNMGWEEYSRRALTSGLSPRSEMAYDGRTIAGLEEALRTFELHPGQCGMMIFAADALSSVTIASHPDDYARMHRSLLLDSFGELVWRYACLYRNQYPLTPLERAPAVKNLAELGAYVGRLRQERVDLFESMGQGIFDREIEGEVMRTMGPFQMERFLTDLALGEENHIGECIRREDGTIEYLKTFRLSSAQGRKAHLLRALHRSDWNIEATAERLGTSWEGVMGRIIKAGFEYLLHPHQLDRLRKGRP